MKSGGNFSNVPFDGAIEGLRFHAVNSREIGIEHRHGFVFLGHIEVGENCGGCGGACKLTMGGWPTKIRVHPRHP